MFMLVDEHAELAVVTRNIIADNIKLFRQHKGLTQKKLADEIGVTNQSIIQWEGAKVFPSVPKLVELSAFFDITLDELVLHEHNATLNIIP